MNDDFLELLGVSCLVVASAIAGELLGTTQPEIFPLTVVVFCLVALWRVSK